ncbi:MAG TPA: hypothetical protein VM165_15955 [Planctomycetaceae bacterium]|nr:hypothetical protein [Planctomycetaceae bacterium]
MKLWCAVLLTAVLSLSGCGPRPKTPAELLPGTWTATTAEAQLTLTLRSDGTFHWRNRGLTIWTRLLGLDIDHEGRWQLSDRRLTMTTNSGQPLPTTLALSGIRSEEMSGVIELVRVDDTSLILQPFRPHDPSERTHYPRQATPAVR